MASGPKVSVLLELVDRMTSPLNGAGSAVKGFGAKLKSLGAEAKGLLENKLVQGIGLVGMAAGLRKAFDEADRLEASVRRLGATAKITGTPLELLEDVAKRGQQQFKLSAVQANDFAVEMAKLASKAGDVGQAAPALDAFLNIGAARGLTASETLKAVQQAILGIDEGTDKLFNANPSVLYKEYADAIGTSAGKLTDQEKAQALLTRAMQDGLKVGGSYAEFLASAAGQQELLKNRTEAAAAALGQALGEVRGFVLPLLADLAEGFQTWLQAYQMAWAELGFIFQGIGPATKKMAGEILIAFSGLIGESRPLLMLFGDAATDLANSMGDAGVRMVREASRTQRDIKAGRLIMFEELGWIGAQGEAAVTATVAQGGADRKELTAEEIAAREQAAKDSARRLEQLNEEIAVMTLMWEKGLTEQKAKELLQRQRDLGEASNRQVATIAEAYQRIDALNVMLGAGFRRAKLEVTEFTGRIETMAHHATTVTVPAVERVGTTAQTTAKDLDKTARTAVDAAHGMGLLDDAGKGVLNTMINVGSAIKDAIAGGWSTGGIIGVVAGVGSLLKGLFGGKSPAQIAAERALRKNTEVIEANTRQVGDLTRLQSPGAKLTSLRDVLAGFAPGASQMVATMNPEKFQRDLAAALMAGGLGMDDLDKVAADLGITIRRSDGRFLAQGLRDLLTMLGQIEPTQFAETFAGRRAALREETNLFDLSPVEQAQRLAALAGGPLGSGIIGQRLGGLDFTTAEGRAAGVAAIQQLFRDLPGLSAADLGGLTGSQFLEVLSDLKDLLTTELPAAVTTGVTEAVGDGGLGEVAPTADTPAPSVSLADLVMTATRSEAYLASIADYTSALPTMTGLSGGLGRAARVEVHGGIHVNVNTPTGAGATDIADATVAAINDRLGALYRLELMARGAAEIPG